MAWQCAQCHQVYDDSVIRCGRCETNIPTTLSTPTTPTDHQKVCQTQPHDTIYLSRNATYP
jgi:hypothetical protein